MVTVHPQKSTFLDFYKKFVVTMLHFVEKTAIYRQKTV